MQTTRFLLVEDDPDDAILIVQTLKSYGLINEIDVVEDNSAALDILRSQGNEGNDITEALPSLVIHSAAESDKAGLAFLRSIRKEEHLKTLPVVVLSAFPEESMLNGSYKLGAIRLVSKPLDFTEFTTAVAQLGLCWLLLNQQAGKQTR